MNETRRRITEGKDNSELAISNVKIYVLKSRWLKYSLREFFVYQII